MDRTDKAVRGADADEAQKGRGVILTDERAASMCSIPRGSPVMLHLLVLSALLPIARTQPLPTGRPVPELSRLDSVVQELMQRYDIPGAALAVVKADKLVMARGYGLAETQSASAVKPYSRFRIAGLTQAITAVATLQLVEQGKLKLDSKLSDVVPELATARSTDPRVGQITIEELLSHTSAWLGNGAEDPARWYDRAVSNFGSLSPGNMYQVMASAPLQAQSGQSGTFSNVAYELLGKCIEKASGTSYFNWINEHVLRPSGIVSMSPARTLAAERQEDEVEYFDYAGAGLRRAVLPGSSDWLRRPYGGSFLLEYAQAHAGLVGSVIDLSRFATALDGRRGTPLLAPSTFRSMLQRPSPGVLKSATYAGKGLYVHEVSPGSYDWWASGSMEGSVGIIKTYASGVSYILLLSGRPASSEAPGDPFQTDVEQRISEALADVGTWPDFDLFQPHPPTIRIAR